MIENDRLKTTLTILNQKLKVQQDENLSLKTAIDTLNEDLVYKDSKISKIINDLQDSETARKALQDALSDLNDKLIGIEEELYESKNNELELLE